jgi:DNA-binding SARP family transcriptional activator
MTQRYFGPEPKAKHALEQLIYSLRQERDEPLVAGPDPVRINHHVLAVDVAEFTAAIERGDRAEAVRLYRGAFLDGFYLSGAPEFEAWAESERGRLAGMYREVLERLAREQVERNDVDSAVESWRRLVTADPLSSSATLGLMRGLVARGDRSGAWQHGKAYEDLVRKELDRDPDPGVRALLTELDLRTPPS